MFDRLIALVVFSLVSLPTIAQANNSVPVITVTPTESEETIFSLGLRFSFGDMVPEVVGAVRSTTTETDSDVTGVQADIAVPLAGDNQGKAKVRVLGLFGDRDLLGQAGIGFNFGSGNPMLAGGIQGENFEGGANIEADGFDPYFGLNLFDSPAEPGSKTETTVQQAVACEAECGY